VRRGRAGRRLAGAVTSTPPRLTTVRPDQVRDVIDVREDCATAATVLALIAQMIRVLLADRPEDRARHGSAAVTVGAVKVVLPARYGRPGRARPLKVDEAVSGGYEAAVEQVLTALAELGSDRALSRGHLRDRPGAPRDERLRRALDLTGRALGATRALTAEVYATGVDVCGFDLSELVVNDLERLELFRWDSTTRWPRRLVDAVFERSISTGDGTMLIRSPVLR
jgi:hypothetical protein